MRDLLTVLAVALIATLVVALAGPHFIDWTSQRANIDAALGEALGLDMETRGGIELRLLPSPVLKLQAASVRGLRRNGAVAASATGAAASPAATRPEPLLTTGQLRVELALAPLLGGKWHIVDASVDRPVLRLAGPQPEAAAAQIAGASKSGLSGGAYSGPALEPSLDVLRITNGILIVTDAQGAPRLVREGINASLQAAALRGPWRASGSLGDTPFNLTTGVYAPDGAMRLRIAVGDQSHGRLEFDGQANFAGAGWPGAAGRISFMRFLDPDVADKDRRPDAAHRISLTSDATLAGGVLDAQKIRVELGDPAAPVRFEGQGGGNLARAFSSKVDATSRQDNAPIRHDREKFQFSLKEFTASTALDFDLKARRLDIAALPLGSVDNQADAFTATVAAVQALAATAAPFGAVTVRLSADTLAWGEEETGPAGLMLRIADSVVALGDGRIAMPGGATLAVSGDLRATPRPFVALNARLDAPQPALLAPWLRRLGVGGDISGWLARQKRLTLSGRIGASRELLAVHGLKLQTGEGELTGIVASRAGDLRTPSRLDAQLAARGLDLAGLPSVAWLGESLNSIAFHDEDGHADAALTLTGEQLRFGAAAAAGSVLLRANRSRQGVAIADFSVTNLGGVDISASGSLTGNGQPLSGKVRASSMAALATLVGKTLPGGGNDPGASDSSLEWASQALRSPQLSRPVNLSFTTGMQTDGGAVISFEGELAQEFEKEVAKGLAKELVQGPADRQIAAGPLARGHGQLVLAAPDKAGALRLASGSIKLAGANPAPFFAAFSSVPGIAQPNSATSGPWQATIDLTHDAGALRARLAIDAAGALLTLTPEDRGARLALVARDGANLLQAVGWPQTAPGALKLDGRLSWAAASQPWRLTFTGDAGGGPVSGVIGPLGGRGLAADLRVERLSLPVLAQTLVLGPIATGEASWSSRRFAAAPVLPGDPASGASRALELSLKARYLDLGAGFGVTDASLGVSSVEDGIRFALAPSALSMGKQSGTAGGKLAGTMLLRRQGGSASIAADVRLVDAQPGNWGVRGLDGVAAVEMKFGAAGESMASLVANLAGNGEARLRGGRLLQMAANAPAEAARRLSGELSGLDGKALLAAVAEQLGKGNFALGDVTAPIVMASGIARIDAPPVADGAAVFDSEVAVDLRTMFVVAVARLGATVAPPRWKGAPPAIAIDWRGPWAAPVRTLGVGELQAGLAAIRLEDELQRVEGWKAEARQLQEQDRLRREELARQQEIQRKQDLERKQEQARIARETGADKVDGQAVRPPESATGDAANRPRPVERLAPLPPERPLNSFAPTPSLRFP